MTPFRQEPATVALRKESVDRNMTWGAKKYATTYVALRKESVDRNTSVVSSAGTTGKSLSARRAWIEMQCNFRSAFKRSIVALRKESVDRNSIVTPHHPQLTTSLSARRAWIEISLITTLFTAMLSLSARRAWIEIVVDGHTVHITRSRSPQGERG